MADSSYDFTQGSGTSARSTTDGTSKHSPNTVIEFQNGSTQPQPVSSANPLPVTGTVSLGAIDNAVLDDIAAKSTTTAAGFAAEGAALGSGVLLQGDDGTDRKNINVDATTGDVQVDVTNTVAISGSVTATLAVVASTNNSSGTAGAASSQLVAANANRTGKVLLYNSSTTETVHFNEGGTASSANMPIRPGERIATEAGFLGAINIIRGGSVDATVFYIEGQTA